MQFSASQKDCPEASPYNPPVGSGYIRSAVTPPPYGGRGLAPAVSPAGAIPKSPAMQKEEAKASSLLCRTQFRKSHLRKGLV